MNSRLLLSKQSGTETTVLNKFSMNHSAATKHCTNMLNKNMYRILCPRSGQKIIIECFVVIIENCAQIAFIGVFSLYDRTLTVV